MSYKSGMIDLTDYEAEDLVIDGLLHNTLSIQFDGNGTIEIEGKHSALENTAQLSIIDMLALQSLSSITESGLYLCSIDGIDEIHFTVSGTGKIHWKEIGD